MAVSILGSAGATHGVETAETGIKCTSYSVRYFPQVDAPLLNESGETVDCAVSATPSREFTIEGAVTGSTGLMALTFVAAATIAGDKTTFGGSGGIYLKEATESQGNESWRNVSLRLSSAPGLA